MRWLYNWANVSFKCGWDNLEALRSHRGMVGKSVNLSMLQFSLSAHTQRPLPFSLWVHGRQLGMEL